MRGKPRTTGGDRFPSPAATRTASGEVKSNTSVKDAIQDLIPRESPAKPLSDQEIVQILSERGIPAGPPHRDQVPLRAGAASVESQTEHVSAPPGGSPINAMPRGKTKQ